MFITSLNGADMSPTHLEKLAESHSFVFDARFEQLDLNVRLPCYTVRWAIDGEIELTIDDERCTLTQQHYLIVNPDQHVLGTTASEGECHALIVCISRALLHKAFTGLSEASRCLHDSEWPVSFHNRLRPHDDTVSPLLRDILRAVELGVQDRLWLDKHLLILSEMLLFREQRQRKSVTATSLNKRLERARTYIDERFREPLRLTDLAELAYASPHHFLREFRKAYGATPHQYLTGRRLEVARNLLHTTQLPVSEIGARVGFASVNGFYKAFRRRYDCPPTAFRQDPRP